MRQPMSDREFGRSLDAEMDRRLAKWLEQDEQEERDDDPDEWERDEYIREQRRER